MKRLEAEEKNRVIDCVKEFISPNGAVVAFQKNAWDALRSDIDPEYRLALAKKGKLKGTLKDIPKVPLYCVPPTRLVGPARQVLEKIRRELLDEIKFKKKKFKKRK